MAEELKGGMAEEFYMQMGREDLADDIIDIGSPVRVKDYPQIDPERVFIVTRFDDEGNCYLSAGGGELPEVIDIDNLTLFTDQPPIEEDDENIGSKIFGNT